VISFPSSLLPLFGLATAPAAGSSPPAAAFTPGAAAAITPGAAAAITPAAATFTTGPAVGLTPAPAAAFTPLPLPANVQDFVFPAATKTPLALSHPWLTHTFATFFVLAAISLIVLLAIQTTKQEGLSGTLGGRVESNYRPRMGLDQQLARITSFIAIAFVVFATIISLSGI
jgi:protein translocase SecG subunit